MFEFFGDFIQRLSKGLREEQEHENGTGKGHSPEEEENSTVPGLTSS